MQGPDREFRSAIAKRIEELATTADAEARLEDILASIEERVQKDEPTRIESEAGAYEELAAAEAWASLASDAVKALYASSSPRLFWRKGDEEKLAGWSTGAAERLRRTGGALRDKLAEAAGHLRGTSFSVGASFPWGVFISIGWTL